MQCNAMHACMHVCYISFISHVIPINLFMVESRMFQLSNPPFFRIKPPLINPHEVIVQSHKITMLDMCSRLTKSQPPFFSVNVNRGKHG
jgi:hypothetical protein